MTLQDIYNEVSALSVLMAEKTEDQNGELHVERFRDDVRDTEDGKRFWDLSIVFAKEVQRHGGVCFVRPTAVDPLESFADSFLVAVHEEYGELGIAHFPIKMQWEELETLRPAIPKGLRQVLADLGMGKVETAPWASDLEMDE